MTRGLGKSRAFAGLDAGQWRVVKWGMLFSLVLPDVDFALRAMWPGVAAFEHGMVMHSFAVAAVYGLFFAGLLRMVWRLPLLLMWCVGTGCYTVHIVMDMLTRGRGVMAFWPVFEGRIASPMPLFYGANHSRPWAIGLHMITLVTELMFAGAMWWIGGYFGKKKVEHALSG